MSKAMWWAIGQPAETRTMTVEGKEVTFHREPKQPTEPPKN
ncbi:MAG TPA: hypothetical protein VN794_01285 [Methylomirabilota bacterium]|nr:hypothetical protein [Methylomirabilota bacterium]